MSHHWSNEKTVSRLLELRAAATPNGIAFQREAADGSWQATLWHEFAARVDSLARAMHTSGLRKGDRLALIAPVSLEWELLHHAALAMGVVVVGLDAHDLPERIAAMVELADITAFAVSDARVLSQVSAGRLNRCHVLLAIGWVADAHQTMHGWQLWDAFNAPSAVNSPKPEAPTGDDTATIIFTSGTTGAPKGIAYRNDQVCIAIEAIRDAFSFVATDGHLLCWLPLSNLFQRMVNLAGLRQGAATYLLADPRRVMQVVASVSPDIFVSVPRFYEKLYDGIQDSIAAMSPLKRQLVSWAWELGRRNSGCRRGGREAPLWLRCAHAITDRLILSKVRGVMGSRLRCMVSGSAPIPIHLLEEFHGLGWLVLEAYGLSENVVPMAMNHIDAFRFGTVGRPLPGNEIVVAEGGAIRVRGPGLFRGYLGDTDQALFDAHGYYLTGDLGALDDDGFLRLTGRSGDMIKTSTGRRIAPAGVEAQLRSVPGIDQAVILGNGRKCLVALCSCTQTGPTPGARAELVAALRQQVRLINEHERPRGIALIERPFAIEFGELTPNLKLIRGGIESRHGDLIRRLHELIDGSEGATAEVLIVI